MCIKQQRWCNYWRNKTEFVTSNKLYFNEDKLHKNLAIELGMFFKINTKYNCPRSARRKIIHVIVEQLLISITRPGGKNELRYDGQKGVSYVKIWNACGFIFKRNWQLVYHLAECGCCYYTRSWPADANEFVSISKRCLNLANRIKFIAVFCNYRQIKWNLHTFHTIEFLQKIRSERHFVGLSLKRFRIYFQAELTISLSPGGTRMLLLHTTVISRNGWIRVKIKTLSRSCE